MSKLLLLNDINFLLMHQSLSDYLLHKWKIKEYNLTRYSNKNSPTFVRYFSLSLSLIFTAKLTIL